MGGQGSSFDQGSSSNQGWMQHGFGGGQSGDMMSSIRDFGRNNRAATIGGGILAILALAGYASSSGKRRYEQRNRGSWQSSGRSRYGDDDSFRDQDFRGGRGYSQDSFSGSRGRYTGASYRGGGLSYGGLRRVGRYGMSHPLGLTVGASLGAMALSWLARGWGGSGQHQGGNWQGSDQQFGGQEFGSGSQGFGGQGFGGSAGGMTGSGSSGGRGFGGGSSGTEGFGGGTMGSDAIEAAGSSSDIGQATSGSSFGRGRTGTSGGI